jgi:hypothetical protein
MGLKILWGGCSSNYFLKNILKFIFNISKSKQSKNIYKKINLKTFFKIFIKNHVKPHTFHLASCYACHQQPFLLKPVFIPTLDLCSMLLFSVLCLSHEIFLMLSIYMLYTCIYESIDTCLLLENIEFTQPKLVNNYSYRFEYYKSSGH